MAPKISFALRHRISQIPFFLGAYMNSLEILIASLIEQQYRFYQLTKLLVARNILKPGQLDQMFDAKEHRQFSHDMLQYLVSIGLKIDENSLSSLLTATPFSLEREAMEDVDRESEKNS